MRCRIFVCVIWSLLASSYGWAQAPTLVLVTESTKPRVGELLRETGLDVEFRDIKDGSTVRTSKATLKRFEKGISDEMAVRFAGLPAVVAWNVAQQAQKDQPVGKVASVSQNVVYITLGESSGVRAGSELQVYRKSREIRDPDTQKVIAVERPKVGSLQITEVQADFSKAKVTSDLELELQIGDEVAPKVDELQVAVLPFRSEKGDLLDVAAGLAEELTTHLVRQNVDVLERSALDKVVTELALQNTVLFEPDNLQRLGELAGATAIVTGKIVATGKLGTAYVRLIDVRTGQIQFAASGTMSLANAKVVASSGSSSAASPGPEPDSAPMVKRRPVPRGAFQSDVVEFTEDSPANWIFKLARVGNPIWSDRSYVFATLPKEVQGGALLWRDSEQTKHWLEPGIVTALKPCTAYAIIRWRYTGKVEVDEVTFSQLLREGWEEIDGNVNTSFPGGEDWRWKIIRKPLETGDVILQLGSVSWNRCPVLFIFK